MKILITTDLYTPTVNGVVTSIVTLKEQLETLGHEVKILTLCGKETPLNRGVYAVPSYSAEKIYPGARIALSIDEETLNDILLWHPEVIHTQCEFSTFRIARQIAHKLDIPIVHTYHTVYEDYTHYFSPNQTWGKKLVSLFSKLVLRNVTHIITPTQKVRLLLEDYGIDVPLHVIPTGIHLKKFTSSLTDEQKQALRQYYNIPQENDLLVTVGRLAKEKNVEELIEFLAKLKDSSISLLIVGDGPYRKKLESLVKECTHSSIHFAGAVEPQDIALYYQLGDVFVSASTSETQGLTYVEALASGTPALCRKDDCLNDVIYEGINGYQYETFEHFQDRLHTILSNRTFYEKLATQAQISTRRTHSAEQFAREIEKIYTQAMKEHTSYLSLTG